MTDGSVVLRLQAAERHLAELENVLPVEAQRKQAGSEVQNAEARAEAGPARARRAARHVAVDGRRAGAAGVARRAAAA